MSPLAGSSQSSCCAPSSARQDSARPAGRAGGARFRRRRRPRDDSSCRAREPGVRLFAGRGVRHGHRFHPARDGFAKDAERAGQENRAQQPAAAQAAPGMQPGHALPKAGLHVVPRERPRGTAARPLTACRAASASRCAVRRSGCLGGSGSPCCSSACRTRWPRSAPGSSACRCDTRAQVPHRASGRPCARTCRHRPGTSSRFAPTRRRRSRRRSSGRAAGSWWTGGTDGAASRR